MSSTVKRPASLPLPTLASGDIIFESIEAMLDAVKVEHEREDPERTPYKSKYKARVWMTDILALLRPLLNDDSIEASNKQWLIEQIGRIEYMLGVNHVDTEETSAGERLLSKGIEKFRSAIDSYPLDILQAYNNIATVWSNRGEHTQAHDYLSEAQNVYLQLKKTRLQLLSQLDVALSNSLSTLEQLYLEEGDYDGTEGDSLKDITREGYDILGRRFPTAAERAEQFEKRQSLEAELTSLLPADFKPWCHPSLWVPLIERAHTMTLFFLAQVYGHMGRRDLAAIYCHLTLNRQLKHKSNFNKVDWVTNAIGLSFYYSGRKQFQQAHHCLTAAQSFIPEADLPKENVKNTAKTDTTRMQQLGADLCRAWGAFYLKWLQRSRDYYIDEGFKDGTEQEKELNRLYKLDREKERHYEEQATNEVIDTPDIFAPLSAENPIKASTVKEGKLSEEESQRVADEMKKGEREEREEREAQEKEQSNQSTSSTSQKSGDSPVVYITFKSLNLPPSPPCHYANSYSTALPLFKQAQSWFTRAASFYILDGFVSDHIPIMQDLSLIHKLLSVFSPDLQVQCQLHKRRLDLLSPIVTQLSLASYQEFIQQISDEVATTYADMADLKMMILNSSKFTADKQASAQQKINEFCLNSIKFYTIWLTSWSKDGKEVEELDRHYQRWYLQAMFKVARMYSKIFHPEPRVMNTFIKKSFEQYKAVIEKTKKWHAEDLFQQELELCEEMVKLLPLKMDKVVAHGGFKV